MLKRLMIAGLFILISCNAAQAQFTRTEDLRVRPPEAWKPHELYGLDLVLGGGYLNGNVKNFNFSGGLEFDWKPAAKHSIFVQASDNYVKYGTVSVTDKSRGSLLYAYALKPHLNLFLQTTHSHDRFRSVEYRMTNTAGLCVHNFLPGGFKPLMLSAGLTPGYEENNDGKISRDLRGTARATFASALTGTVKLNADIIYMPKIADTSDSRLYSEMFFELKVWKESVAFRITASDEYESKPFPGVKNNDFGLSHALVVKFAK